MSQNPRYGNPPPLRKGLASARERQKPVPQASAMQDISPSWIILSVLPIVVLLGVALITMWLGWKRKANESRKDEFLNRLGYLATADGVGQEEKETDTSELRNRKIKAQLSPKEPKASKKPIIVGFWHPYCNAGGGGERVLWTAIYWALRESDSNPSARKVLCVVYSGDYPQATKEDILSRVQSRFQLPLHQAPYRDRIEFLALPSRRLISDTYWKRFTLIGQSLGSVLVAAEGIGLWGKTNGFWSDVFIDTMGHPFTLPLVSFVSGSRTPLGAYVHYPVISTDMINRVRQGEWGVESGSQGGLKGWRRMGKLAYYRIFTRLYAISLLFANELMTNSSWTQAHIKDLLRLGRSTWLAYILNLDVPSSTKQAVNEERCRVVYPPCDTGEFLHLPLQGRGRQPTLTSLAQFRPEKDQAKQLQALGILFQKYPKWKAEGVGLVLMGSCRDEVDEARIEGLRELSRTLEIEDSVEFVVNAPFPEIVKRLGQASIGLNTMKDEHFGISVVEFMAAGLIPLAHASAGPLLDIIVPYRSEQTGMHAVEAEEFAEKINEILSLPISKQERMREMARKLAVDKFSQECFEKGWESSWEVLMRSVEQTVQEDRLRRVMEDRDR